MTLVLLVWLVGATGQRGLAQSCAERLGDLLINQTFGDRGTSPALAGRTTYRAVTKRCPDNGEYAIADAVDGTCFDASWHTVARDHTSGVVGGNLLIINASEEPGAFYQQPVPELCPGTSYEFSVWGMNLLRPTACSNPQLPSLTISVETVGGRILQTIRIGVIEQTDTPTWRRFSALFVAPTTREVVTVKLINERGSGGCGNDLALDDIQLKQCGDCPPAPAYVPDAFTPNNDGVNDRLMVFLREPLRFDLRIFNRWGNLIFTSDTVTQTWDGTCAGSPCPVGTYAWVMTYQLANPDQTTQEYVKKGQVLLLR